MIRITEKLRSEEQILVFIEGRLDDSGTAMMEELLERYRHEGVYRVTLQLDGLQYLEPGTCQHLGSLSSGESVVSLQCSSRPRQGVLAAFGIEPGLSKPEDNTEGGGYVSRAR